MSAAGPGREADWRGRGSPRMMGPVIRTTPFHERLSQLNSQGLYTHWQGFLSPLRYSTAPKHEYFAVRNSVGVFDTSPLFKYAVRGPTPSGSWPVSWCATSGGAPRAGRSTRSGATTAAS